MWFWKKRRSSGPTRAGREEEKPPSSGRRTTPPSDVMIDPNPQEEWEDRGMLLPPPSEWTRRRRLPRQRGFNLTVEEILRTPQLARRINMASAMIAVLVAWLLAGWLPVSEASNVLTEDEKIFTAYDCSLPANVTSVSLASVPRECSEQHMKSQQTKVTYNLLQKTNRVKVNMYNSRAKYSRIVFVCGAATHSSIASREWLFGMDYPLSFADHKDLWNNRRFKRPHWQPDIFRLLGLKGRKEWDPIPLTIGQTARFAWDVVGGTKHNDNDVYCQGQSLPADQLVDFESVNLKEAVMTYLMEVTIDEYDGWYYLPTAEEPKGHMEVQLRDHGGTVRLPDQCHYESSHCTTKKFGTFEWGIVTGGVCPYFRIKQTTGIDTPASQEGGFTSSTQSTFVSTDDAMIRLRRKGKPIPACGGIVQATELDSLFLTTDVDHGPFNAMLGPEEASAYLYSTVSDYFIHEKIQDDLERTVLQLQQHECRENAQSFQQQLARKAAEQQALAEGGTAHLGNGRFFTARGDAGFVYTCRELEVMARSTDGKCFNSLAVELMPAEKEAFKRVFAEEEEVSGEAATLPDFYLEPKTHRLLTTAAEEPCLDDLAPLYQNKRGNWVSVLSNALSLAIPPVLLENDTSALYRYQRRPIDISEGGIYEKQLLKKIHSYLQTRNVESAVLGTMNQNYRRRHDGQTFSAMKPLQLDDFYPNAPSMDALTVITSMNWMWYALVQYWRVATILLAMGLVFKVTRYVLASCVRLCGRPDTPSPCLHFLSAFCPDLAFFCKAGRYRPNGPHGPFREVFAACASRRDLATPEASDEDEVIRFRKQKQRRQTRRAQRPINRQSVMDGESEHYEEGSVVLRYDQRGGRPVGAMWRNNAYADLINDARGVDPPPPSAVGAARPQGAEEGGQNQGQAADGGLQLPLNRHDDVHRRRSRSEI